MGTNYYWYPRKPCECCGREFSRHHIGKSSAGWCFGLHVSGGNEWPPDDLPPLPSDIDGWRALWATPGSSIRNEYGDVVPVDEMERIVTERSWPRRGGDWMSPNWYSSNHAERGPDGLARHRIYSGHCIGHGEGTWDHIVGEFS